MSHPFLQICGGLFYLLNKIFFCAKERATDNERKRAWKIWSWIVYLIGLPAWVIIFIDERNWIAASLEAGGAPAMILGLTNALRGKGNEPKWLDYIALVAICLGLSCSVYDFHGITTWRQIMELGIVTGFLIGTYQLAKERPSGYLWFILMNGSNAALMWVEHYPWLVLQQVVSLAFVIDAYATTRRKKQV